MPDIPIRADVSLSIHPDALSPHAAALERKPGTLASAQAALGDAYHWLCAVNDAEAALAQLAKEDAPAKRRQHPDGRSEYLGDLRMTAGGLRQFHGREEELAEAAAVHMEKVTRRIDTTRASLTETAVTLDRAVDFALTDDDPKTKALASEVRAHVKSLPAKERFGFVQSAISSGDLVTVSAVVNAQPFLSGMKPEEAGQLRILAAQAFAAEAVRQRQAVGALIEAVERTGSEVVKRFSEVKRGADNPRAAASRKLAQLRKGGAV